jgi:hypothetical protein
MRQTQHSSIKAAVLGVSSAVLLLGACTPTVKVEAPDKPIEINLNVKVQQDVRVRVDKDLEKEISQNPDLFGL